MYKIQFIKQKIKKVKDEMDILLDSEIDICTDKVVDLGNQLDQLILDYMKEKKIKGKHK